MTVKHWGGEAGIVQFNVHIPCSSAWDTMISYMALISTLGMMHGKVLANPAPNRIKKKVSPQVEVILVDNKRWNQVTENQIKFIDVVKEWMHGCVMENVRKIKIKFGLTLWGAYMHPTITYVPLIPLAIYGTYSGLYPSDQDRLTPSTVILSDHDPGLHHGPLITHEPSMSSLHEREYKWDREHDCKWEWDSQPPGHPFMPPISVTIS